MKKISKRYNRISKWSSCCWYYRKSISVFHAIQIKQKCSELTCHLTLPVYGIVQHFYLNCLLLWKPTNIKHLLGILYAPALCNLFLYLKWWHTEKEQFGCKQIYFVVPLCTKHPEFYEIVNKPTYYEYLHSVLIWKKLLSIFEQKQTIHTFLWVSLLYMYIVVCRQIKFIAVAVSL